MSNRKLIVCNPGIFFEDNAPAAYPWLLDKLGRGDEARAIQTKYEAGKIAGPLLLPEMAALFGGVRRSDLQRVCRKYCFQYARRETFQMFEYLHAYGHCCMLVTSLPEEICAELSDLVRAGLRFEMIVASQVITGGTKVCLRERETRKDFVVLLIEKIVLPHENYPVADWEDVLVVGNSLTDIPLGKAVREKGGRFIAFHPKDTEIKNAVQAWYGDTCSLKVTFMDEGLA
ncbi:MAG: hypothetical protein HYT94_01760 [Parcubacteria group bacterium]|nr:hypothetical protein [Parcubacteria group bacterium]